MDIYLGCLVRLLQSAYHLISCPGHSVSGSRPVNMGFSDGFGGLGRLYCLFINASVNYNGLVCYSITNAPLFGPTKGQTRFISFSILHILHHHSIFSTIFIIYVEIFKCRFNGMFH